MTDKTVRYAFFNVKAPVWVAEQKLFASVIAKCRHGLLSGLVASLPVLPVADAAAANWGVNELQYQYGNLNTPTFVGGGSHMTHILTFQHASAWQYGTNFLFVDFSSDNKKDGFNDRDFYGEWYPTLSIPKVLGADAFKVGPVNDIRVVTGVNVDADSKVRKFLPGIQLGWNVPGFIFLNTELEAYLDYSEGAASGGAPKQTDSWIFDVSWAYPFRIGSAKFSLEGHAEYIDSRKNQFGGEVSWWMLAQPQLRFDLGDMAFNKANHLFIGTEMQVWLNKLGDPKTDEFAPQLLVVWRL